MYWLSVVDTVGGCCQVKVAFGGCRLIPVDYCSQLEIRCGPLVLLVVVGSCQLTAVGCHLVFVVGKCLCV